MIEELEDVILTCDLPKYGLRRGDIGTVVLVHKQGKGYEVRVHHPGRRNPRDRDLGSKPGSSKQTA